MSISPRKAIAANSDSLGRIRFLRAEGKGILRAMPTSAHQSPLPDGPLYQLRTTVLFSFRLHMYFNHISLSAFADQS